MCAIHHVSTALRLRVDFNNPTGPVLVKGRRFLGATWIDSQVLPAPPAVPTAGGGSVAPVARILAQPAGLALPGIGECANYLANAAYRQPDLNCSSVTASPVSLFGGRRVEDLRPA
jgi:hypothetical protein